MALEFQDYAVIITFTTILTTASTSVIALRIKESLRREICSQLTETKKNLYNDIQTLFVKVGILEAKHKTD